MIGAETWPFEVLPGRFFQRRSVVMTGSSVSRRYYTDVGLLLFATLGTLCVRSKNNHIR